MLELVLRADDGFSTVCTILDLSASDDIVLILLRPRGVVFANEANLTLRLEDSPLNIGKPGNPGKAHLRQDFVARQPVAP